MKRCIFRQNLALFLTLALQATAPPGETPINSQNIRPLEATDNQQFRSLWVSALTEQAQFFRTALADDRQPNIPTDFTRDSFTLGAFDGDALVGILSLQRDKKHKLQHKALIFGMYVRPQSAGAGLGKAMLSNAIARVQDQAAIRQLYLTVLATNHRAVGLYRSLGFDVFAHEPQSVNIRGTYTDEHQMVLLLDRS
ncbi:MAG: N-acetyltransferase family protein [Cellvibrionales bacterium]